MTEDSLTPESPTPEALVADLIDLLDVEEIDIDLHRGRRLRGGRGRVFGGQVIAQGLVAAMRSVEGKAVHSLHAYFMRGGDENYPIIYRVVRDFDGRSFANRRVIAMQRGRPILNMTASFQKPEEGLSHQFAMPDVPPPGDLLDHQTLIRRAGIALPEATAHWLMRPRPIEMRPVEQDIAAGSRKRPPRDGIWFRLVAPVGDDADVHRALIAYASDMVLLRTATLPHGIGIDSTRLLSASLDHALWFHEPVRPDEWLLYATDAPWSGHGRGFTRGQIFTQDGRLVASVAQEGVIRLADDNGG